MTQSKSSEVSDRDPIALTGELGEELDPFRPHGGHPRNRMDTAPPTDPITHNLPGNNFQTNHMKKQYNERWTYRDPILHNYDEAVSKSLNRSAEMRHFPQRTRSFDPITNLPSPHAVTQERRTEGTSMKGNSISPLTIQMANNSINAADSWPRHHSGRGRGLYSSQRVYRNPITGEGMKEEDYSDSVTFARQYVLKNRRRQFSHTQSPTRVHQPESEKVVNKPIPRTQQTTRMPEPKKRLPVDRKPNPTETKDRTVDKTPEKKVVRPKRMPTQPTTVTENGANENGELKVQTPNQSAVEPAQPFETPEPAGMVEEVYKPEIVDNHEEHLVTPAQSVIHAEQDEPESQHDDVFDTESSS
ncbi:surface protein PspC [Clonorchis sinensis]|uniref:Surface protein PspC n=1 Tax=Clonorchis sinensis TaxID=79923 RepID=G7Y7T7_CLOSI|nr:surface protein PspC [Clonorchis sinensis]